MFHAYLREGHTMHEQAETLIALSTEHGFPLWLAVGTIMRGWALATQGDRDEGMTQLYQGLSAFPGENSRTHYLALLAEAFGNVGQLEAGLCAIAETLTVVEKNGERYYEAETYRLKGELLLHHALPDAHQAETCLHHALSVARSQQAKSWELRAAMSLARLWQSQGKRRDAHDLLAPVYEWFTEGFDTADLQDAKALLEELEDGR
jgi:predicted ATPase